MKNRPKWAERDETLTQQGRSAPTPATRDTYGYNVYTHRIAGMSGFIGPTAVFDARERQQPDEFGSAAFVICHHSFDSRSPMSSRIKNSIFARSQSASKSLSRSETRVISSVSAAWIVVYRNARGSGTPITSSVFI